MLHEIVRGSATALVRSGIACFGLFNWRSLVPFDLYFLLAWFAWSVFRVIQEVVRGSHRRLAAEWDRERFFFWLGAALSSLFAPVPFVIVGAVAMQYFYR